MKDEFDMKIFESGHDKREGKKEGGQGGGEGAMKITFSLT